MILIRYDFSTSSVEFQLDTALRFRKSKTIFHLISSKVFSSPELKAQVSFPDHLSSVVCLSVRPSVRPSSVCPSVCLFVCL